jgi:L-ascorbate metabolism protein UlaG (beta-lactamase superfamily)
VYLGNPCGVVLDAREGHKILHMGDTEIFPGMALINEIHQPEIGIVPIGDRFTMGARTAAMACRKFFNFKTVIPCHYGTFGLIAPNTDQFIAEMSPDPVTVPKVGEVLTV